MTELETFVRGTLGHEARDLDLFERALTHSSLGRHSYERLEFLGDRVLGLVVASVLYERYPTESEGQMSRRYNALVARETCAEIGREIGLPKLIRVGKQAREDRASESDNVVGDVVEALIGALFVDSGLEAAQRFILAAWARFLEEPGPRARTPQVGASGARRRARTARARIRARCAHGRAPRASLYRPRLGAAARRGGGRRREQAGSRDSGGGGITQINQKPKSTFLLSFLSNDFWVSLWPSRLRH